MTPTTDDSGERRDGAENPDAQLTGSFTAHRTCFDQQRWSARPEAWRAPAESQIHEPH
jgi:hypothetical protein